MRDGIRTAAVLLLAVATGAAQVASHAPTGVQAPPSGASAASPSPAPSLDKPVARVNGAVLTERDLEREIYTIFPYAKQHNGVPRAMEGEMRRGALDMVIFEELAYQEAARRKMTISAERIKSAQATFRKQFASQQQFDEFLRVECKGSRQVLDQKMRRSLLIEALLKTEVGDKAKVTLAEARAYYDKNPARFQRPESFSLQTISIIPPANASAEVQKEARRRADDALRLVKETRSYQDFGLLAEKVSDDDWHVRMGDRRTVEASALPPEVVKVARTLKPGQVSGLIPLGPNYTLIRLNGHTEAGRISFDEAKDRLRSDMERARYEQLRKDLYKKLRGRAKVEEL